MLNVIPTCFRLARKMKGMGPGRIGERWLEQNENSNGICLFRSVSFLTSSSSQWCFVGRSFLRLQNVSRTVVTVFASSRLYFRNFVNKSADVICWKLRLSKSVFSFTVTFTDQPSPSQFQFLGPSRGTLRLFSLRSLSALSFPISSLAARVVASGPRCGH